jgi:TPR repeat protein
VQAVEWFRKAADQGHARAQGNLGWMYERGRGVAQDDVQAVEWYCKAADQGDAPGQCNLGWMYERGRGVVAKDDVQAAKWYCKAAEQPEAQAAALKCLLAQVTRYHATLGRTPPVNGVGSRPTVVSGVGN